jgi:flagellin-specific chaperone FliS
LGQSPPAVLAKQALEHFNRAQAALRDQDWTRYGEELKKMRLVLEELAKR